MKNNCVAVIGAGLGGLYAARLLARANVDYVVLEARQRLGGRILSERIPVTQHPDGGAYDLGPAWYWPAHQTRMPKLVRELGLQPFEQHVEGAFLYEHSETERERIEHAPLNSGSMRIEGGMERLIAALESQLDPRRLHRGCRVASARLERGCVELGVANPDGEIGARTVRYVISTLPPRLLARSVCFAPSLPQVVIEDWSSIPTWMAAHAKFVAVYARPFWRENGFSGGAQSRRGPMAEIHDASPLHGLPALFGFIGVPARIRRVTGRTLEGAALAQLERLFGREAASPLFTFYKDWSTDPFLATGEDDAPTRTHPSYGRQARLPDQWAANFILAGTETAHGHGGLLEGALETSEGAVAEVIARITARRPLQVVGG